MSTFSQAHVIYQIHSDIAFIDLVFAGIVLIDTCQRNCILSHADPNCYHYYFSDGSVLFVQTDPDGTLIPFWYDSVQDM